MRVAIEPGQIEELRASESCDTAGCVTATVRSSAPLPTIRLDNLASGRRTVTLLVENIDPRAVVLPIGGPLPDERNVAQECASTDDDVCFQPGPLRARSSAERSSTFVVPMAGCSSIELRLAPPGFRDEYRVAVVGALYGDEGALASIIDDINDWRADWVAFLGNLANAGDATNYEPFVRAVELLEGPYSVTPGRQEMSDGGVEFFEEFGRYDYAAFVGFVPVLSLNTASAEVSDAQASFVASVVDADADTFCDGFDAIGDNVTAGLVLAHRPPLDPVRLRRHGISATHVGARLHAALLQSGFGVLLASSGVDFERQSFSGLEVIDFVSSTPDDSADVSPVQYLRVTVRDFWTETPTVDIERRTL